MQKLDNDFFETYKHLNSVCSDMYKSKNGVSDYISNMEATSLSDSCKISDWDDFYKKLKHLRWLRNQIAHDSISSDFNISEASDLQDVNLIYEMIMHQQDPLAVIERSKRKVANPKPKSIHYAKTNTNSTKSKEAGLFENINDFDTDIIQSVNKSNRKKKNGFVWFVALIFVLAVLAAFLFGLGIV